VSDTLRADQIFRPGIAFRGVRLKSVQAATQRKEISLGHIADIEIADLVGAYPTCGQCGTANVVRDAWASWSLLTRDWSLKAVFDSFACDACGEETTPVWKIDKAFRLKRIQRLNDALRQGQGEHASVVVTAGLQHRGEDFLAKTHQAVAAFDCFSGDKDPHGEHDFGALTIEGEKLFWKIDYFDRMLTAHSPDKANPQLTHRVLTIMLASEY
jgi:Protein of unknown function (DUF3768)